MNVQDLLIHDEEPSQTATAKGKQSARSHAPPLEIKYFGIEFIHDTICPFCYIGLKNLLRAIDVYKSTHPDAVFEVTCTPFILAPTARTSYCDKYHYYHVERGLPASRFEVWDRLGRDAGIQFKWTGRTGNSRNSHKLLRFALQDRPTNQVSTEFAQYQSRIDVPIYPPYSMRAPEYPAAVPQPRGPDLQMRLLDAITTGYHEHDRDLSDQQILLETAMAVTGFPEHDLRAVLESPEWDAAVDLLSSDVQNRISVRSQLAGPIVAVPTMVLNKRWVYGGFQRADDIVGQFELLRQKINPLREYTTSTLVLDGGVADTIAREAALAKAASNSKAEGSRKWR